MKSFIKRPTWGKLLRAQLGVSLLEGHHSIPRYRKFRLVKHRMSSWRGSGKGYGFWGSGGRRSPKQPGTAKGKSKGKTDKKVEEPNKETKAAFPSYDAIRIPEEATSAASSSSKEGPWQQVIHGLMAANPTLKLTPEIERALQGCKTADNKKEIYDQQRSLNLKRKASLKLERMEQALKRKKFQMDAYREQIRLQLQAEMKRFAMETKDLEEGIAKQRELVERLESGVFKEEDENMENFVDVQEQHTLAALLGLKDDAEAEEQIAQLQKEKQDALMLARKMQERMQLMMNSSPMPGQMGALGSSPQLPLNTERKRPKIEETEVQEIVDSPMKDGKDPPNGPNGGMD